VYSSCVNNYFLNIFNLLKDKTNPHFTQYQKQKKTTNAVTKMPSNPTGKKKFKPQGQGGILIVQIKRIRPKQPSLTIKVFSYILDKLAI
jgi:hypothetical protein